MIILLIYIAIFFMVMGEAVAKAHRDKNNTSNHYLTITKLILVFVIMLLYKYYDVHIIQIVLFYALIRIYAYNYIFNAMLGLPGLYRGNTDDIIDECLGKLSTKRYRRVLMAAFLLSVIVCFIF